MKPRISLLAGVFALCAISTVLAQTAPEITAWKLNRTNATGYNGLPADVQRVQYSATAVYINASGIPSYSIGPWQMNPNVPANRNYLFKIARNPQPKSGTKDSVGLGAIGVWANGVPMYNADDGMSYNNNGTWKRNAYVYEGVSFDACGGHADQRQSYHNHVYPVCLQALDATKHSPIMGYAFDGYPVYGPYAYTNTNGTGAIKRMTSSYQLRNITQRTTLPGSTVVLETSKQGPAVSAQYPLGNFLQDFEYVAGSGDLDQYNGRFAVTPEYPNGTYAYYTTMDASAKPVYPFILGVFYNGTLDRNNSAQRVTITEAVTEFTGAVATPAATLSVSSIAFGSLTVGMNTTRSYTITATNLAANLTITAPAGFGVSSTQNGTFAQTLALTPASGSLSQTVFVRFAPTQAGTFTGNITHQSGTTAFGNIAVTAAATPVSVAMAKEMGITVSPNPAQNLVSVNVPIVQATRVRLTLRNVLGQAVFASEESAANGVFTKVLNVGTFAKGVYFLEIGLGEKTLVEKLVIE
ncbi:MAG: YHYH protein [Candidatus Kapabacteria bacterium]|jgi:hypothetical protein|nr:YHYH protein [Candidatus Kapabacteria bacterium]